MLRQWLDTATTEGPMARYVGYEHDPLPPDRFRVSFGPPPRRRPQRDAALELPPRPVLVPPPPAPPPPAAVAAAPAAPLRLLRPQRQPRQAVATPFPTWKPLPEPKRHIPEHPLVAALEVLDAMPRWQRLGLRLLAALLLLAPVAWLAGWVGLPHSPAEFLMTAPGRLAWRHLGGPDAMVLYWLLLFPVAFGLASARPLRWPLLGLGAMYWAWAGLEAAFGLRAPYLPW